MGFLTCTDKGCKMAPNQLFCVVILFFSPPFTLSAKWDGLTPWYSDSSKYNEKIVTFTIHFFDMFSLLISIYSQFLLLQALCCVIAIIVDYLFLTIFMVYTFRFFLCISLIFKSFVICLFLLDFFSNLVVIILCFDLLWLFSYAVQTHNYLTPSLTILIYFNNIYSFISNYMTCWILLLSDDEYSFLNVLFDSHYFDSETPERHFLFVIKAN